MIRWTVVLRGITGLYLAVVSGTEHSAEAALRSALHLAGDHWHTARFRTLEAAMSDIPLTSIREAIVCCAEEVHYYRLTPPQPCWTIEEMQP